MGKKWILVLCMVWLTAIFHTSVMGADTKTQGAVDSNAALLDVLRDNGTINGAQYDQLKEQIAKEKDKNSLKGVWNNGVGFKSEDGAFSVKLGGRILNDWAVIDADRKLEDAFGTTLLEGSGTEMRQAWLSMSGTIYNNITFKADYDFAGSDADFKDVWMGMKGIPYVGEVRVGHQKEPLSMEQLDNAMYITFMERGISYALVPARNTGIKAHNSYENKIGWAIGAYKDVDDTANGFKDQSDYNITARATILPWYEEKGLKLLHLGLAYSHQYRDGGTVRYRERPETHITEVRLVDTGNITGVDGVDLINPEAGFVYGPISFQGEYVSAKVDSSAAHNPTFDGFYIYGSYFLTGENRQYRMDDGGGEFTQVKIKNNFAFNSPGWGAWEVALRYSTLDLNEKAIQGGEEKNWSAAINWYLNPTLRWSLNYISAKVEDRWVSTSETLIDDADANIWMTRFQISF